MTSRSSTPTWRGGTLRQWVADPLWLLWALGGTGAVLVAVAVVGSPVWGPVALLGVAASTAAVALSGST